MFLLKNMFELSFCLIKAEKYENGFRGDSVRLAPNLNVVGIVDDEGSIFVYLCVVGC